MTRKIGAGALLAGGAACLLLAFGHVQAQQELTLKGPPEPQAVSPLLATELPDYLDNYARGTNELAKTSARFLENYQKFIRTLDALRQQRKSPRGEQSCLADDLAVPYLAARESWERYHRQARLIRNQHRRLDAYQSAGYAPGLTPDLRDRLKRAVDSYARIRQEHIDIQSLLRYQLEVEIRRNGCDPEQLTPPVSAPAVAEAPRDGSAPPTNAAASQTAARTAALAQAAKEPPAEEVAEAAPLIDLETEGLDSEADDGELEPLDASALEPEEIEAPEGLVPAEEPAPGTAQASPAPTGTPKPAPTGTPKPTQTPPPGADADGAPDAAESATTEASAGDDQIDAPAPLGPAALQVRFSVDNRQCSQATVVYLDSRRLGTVPGGKLVLFAAPEGKHTLCLSREGDPKPCADPTDLIKVNLYDGFAVRPRC